MYVVILCREQKKPVIINHIIVVLRNDRLIQGSLEFNQNGISALINVRCTFLVMIVAKNSSLVKGFRHSYGVCFHKKLNSSCSFRLIWQGPPRANFFVFYLSPPSREGWRVVLVTDDSDQSEPLSGWKSRHLWDFVVVGRTWSTLEWMHQSTNRRTQRAKLSGDA